MITINSKVIADESVSKAVRYAVSALRRDIGNACTADGGEGIPIILESRSDIEPECFCVQLREKAVSEADSGAQNGGRTAGENTESLVISASDDLGLIYGIYHVSKTFLGVNEFWFWNEQRFAVRSGYEIPEGYGFRSKPFKVRFRGWFINDEVLIDDWKIDGDNDRPWEMAFEALLRCGGNMTIPGTDENAHIYCKLASDMGLWITHHHAEPMGARMFARAYPDLDASYDRYPELFEGLWKEGIEKQKDYKVIWNLGFRGQGDRPFWADDPAYDTDEKRGKLISSLVRKQYDLIKEHDANAICCSNLYGETMELYRKGLLDIPEDVIFIWADNGFGKMVSRRQGRHNPRVYALPERAGKGTHGIYYHASFYDLQAAAQMTMLPNPPEFVVRELYRVCEKGADDYWMINSSNIKPHAYILDLIARIWKDGGIGDDREAQRYANRHLKEYCAAYYGSCRGRDDTGHCIGNEVEHRSEEAHGKCGDDTGHCSGNEVEQQNADAPGKCRNDTMQSEEAWTGDIEELYRAWSEYAPQYGPNEDDHAGEQFANHGARVLATGLVTNFCKEDPMGTKAAAGWLWFSDKATLYEQIKQYRDIVGPAVRGYREYLDRCEETAGKLSPDIREVLEDTLIWQVKYLYYSYLGALHICDSVNSCLAGKTMSAAGASDSPGELKASPDYLTAFFEAGLAAEAFKTGYEEMRNAEKGVFMGFFNNDCEADIRQSHFVAKGLMSFLRFLGDGPHFYGWQRQFQQGAGGNKVHLILRIKKHLTDDELWELIRRSEREKRNE